MNQVLYGAIGMGCFVAALFFLRFWRSSRDRFYLYFAASFLVQAADRFLLGSFPSATEQQPLFYIIRLTAYVLILIAIVEKNRQPQRR